MSILLVDNYDSFTYNLYQYIGAINPEVEVVRNSNIPFDKLNDSYFSHVIISPGPGNPTDKAYFGDAAKLIENYHDKIPILGVCLGHQGIAAVFGAKIINAPTIKHGKTSMLHHEGKGLLHGLPDGTTVMRYHSLVVDKDSLPDEFSIDAIAEDGAIMAIRHNTHPLFGIQFHPESFCTFNGMKIIQNFIYGQQ